MEAVSIYIYFLLLFLNLGNPSLIISVKALCLKGVKCMAKKPTFGSFQDSHQMLKKVEKKASLSVCLSSMFLQSIIKSSGMLLPQPSAWIMPDGGVNKLLFNFMQTEMKYD